VQKVATILKRRRSDGKLAYRVQDRTTGFPPVSRTFSTLANARAYRRKLETERDEGKAGKRTAARKHTVSDAVEKYYQSPEFKKLKTAKGQRQYLDWWVQEIGRVKLADVTPELVSERLDNVERTRALAPSSRNHYQSALSAVFREVVKQWHWLDVNPVLAVSRRSETGHQRNRIVTPDEYKLLLAACDKLANGKRKYSPQRQVRNLLRMLYGTGARRSEIAHLRWADVNMERGTAYLRDTKNNTARTIVFDGDALEALKDQEREFKRRDWPLVFVGASPRKPGAVPFHFSEVRRLAELDKPDTDGELLYLHSLRHTVATELGDGGASEYEIMAVTGHKTSIQVRRYVKDTENRARAALAKRRSA
jgi:integrase